MRLHGFLRRKKLSRQAAYFRHEAGRRRYLVLVGAAFGGFMGLAILSCLLVL